MNVRYKRILVVNTFGIGDVIFSTPLVEIIKQQFPGIFIGYVCNKRVAEVLATNPFIDKIFVYEKDELRELWSRSKAAYLKKLMSLISSVKKERFDLAIDLSLGYQYSMVMKLIGIRRRLGFNYRKRGRFLTDKTTIEGFDKKYVVDYYLDIVKPLGVVVNGYEIRPRVYEDKSCTEWIEKELKSSGVVSGSMIVGMIPGCGASWGVDARYRRWPKENFANVADRLIDKYDAAVLLMGDQGEADICDDVQRLMKNRAVNYSGKTSIPQLTSLIKRCDLVITNDGGPLHMAAGLGVKTVSIFGPVDEKEYGPYPSNIQQIVITSGDKCRPCYSRFKYKKCVKMDCLKNIRPETVFAAAEKLLKI